MTHSNAKLFNETGTAKLAEISENPAVYTEFLKFQGRIFKQNATVALEFFAQRPDVQFIANAKQWAAAGYRIKDGGEAIHFTDENGNRSDLFDFSQVEGSLAPRLWSINAENADEFKSALELEDNAPIIKSLIEQTVQKSSVIGCMEALGVPPQEFEQFKVTYFNAVQTIIAGRFEIGGNKFDITPNMTAFLSLDDTRKMHFLTMVANTAKSSLLKVEKVANEIATKNIQNQERGELNEKHETNVSTVGSTNTGAAEPNTGEPTAGDSASRTGERTDNVEDDNSRQSASLGDSSRRSGNDNALSGVQAEGSIGGAGVVQVQSDVGILQHEPHRTGTVDGRGIGVKLFHKLLKKR
ncbi:MAG: hypothetical protein LBC86_01270 [Oscillospiraceae bacterium]|jgi:hypothetical protein|nr:hypothetical protein [Oscillospiraceae bacterium]